MLQAGRLTEPMMDLSRGLAAPSPELACGSANENLLTSSLSAALQGEAEAPSGCRDARRERALELPLARRGELRKIGGPLQA